MIQQLTDIGEEVLHAIFLDLYKGYEALDRERCLEILEEYGVGQRDCHTL